MKFAPARCGTFSFSSGSSVSTSAQAGARPDAETFWTHGGFCSGGVWLTLESFEVRLKARAGLSAAAKRVSAAFGDTFRLPKVSAGPIIGSKVVSLRFVDVLWKWVSRAATASRAQGHPVLGASLTSSEMVQLAADP